MLQVFIGFDQTQAPAYQVAERSLRRRTQVPVAVTPLVTGRLAAKGLLRRPVDTRGGRIYDVISNAPCSTEFAISRFLVPILAQRGFALFVDSDVVFLGDVAELVMLADTSKAVQVVKHHHVPVSDEKMAGQQQLRYQRKNWSSVMLFNCDHPANRRLSLDDVNGRPGIDLHNFYWLNDEEIGALPARWNWLVGEQEKPADVKLAHFTNGGPFTPGWKGAEHDDIWLAESEHVA